MPDAEEILVGITWHFLVGNNVLTSDQLAEHEIRQACPACEGKSPAMETATAAEASRG